MHKKVIALIVGIMVIGSVGAILTVRYASAPSTKPEVYCNYRFLVEIDGIVQASFLEVEGLNATADVIEYREGNEQLAPHLLPGLVHYGPLVLRWGLTVNAELWDWMEKTLEGNVDRKNLSVVILDRTGIEITRYNLYDAWPSGWSLGKLDSQGKGPIIEELVVQYEKLDRPTD